MKVVYQHPDGEGIIFFDAATFRLSTSNEAEDLSAYVVIGTAGLRDLSARLLALADEMEGKQ